MQKGTGSGPTMSRSRPFVAVYCLFIFCLFVLVLVDFLRTLQLLSKDQRMQVTTSRVDSGLGVLRHSNTVLVI